MESIPFSSIVYDIPVGITVLRGPSFIVEMANATYLQIVDRKEEHEIEKLPTIDAIPSQMHQLFRNLLSNSLKFTKPEGTPVIKVTSKKEPDGRIHITVADNGIGFEQEFSDYVFKLFKRLHSKSEYDGTGIGLSLCKKIVENHGGEIHAESAPDKGTTMHIILPSHS